MTMLETKVTEYVESLASATCPCCKASKKDGHTFCNRCYWRLPRDHQVAIYRRLGDGYIEAVDAAMEYLKTKRILVKAVVTSEVQSELF